MEHALCGDRQSRNKRRTLRRQRLKVARELQKRSGGVSGNEQAEKKARSGDGQRLPKAREGEWGFWREADTPRS
jgi:hypothetical protein